MNIFTTQIVDMDLINVSFYFESLDESTILIRLPDVPRAGEIVCFRNISFLVGLHEDYKKLVMSNTFVVKNTKWSIGLGPRGVTCFVNLMEEKSPLTEEFIISVGFKKVEYQMLAPVANQYELSLELEGDAEKWFSAVCTNYKGKVETYVFYNVGDFKASRVLKTKKDLTDLYFSLTGQEMKTVG